jgi:heme-degrading monooxygenase HmoA
VLPFALDTFDSCCSVTLEGAEVAVSDDRRVKLKSPGGIEMFMALSRFTIANEKTDEVRAAFSLRPHLVDHAPGFLGMEAMSPLDNQAEIWLLTRWLDEQSYKNWHRSHEYHASHKGIPKGLKLIPGATNLRLFEVFAN